MSGTVIQHNDYKVFIEKDGTARLHFNLNRGAEHSRPLTLTFPPELWRRFQAAVNAPSQE